MMLERGLVSASRLLSAQGPLINALRTRTRTPNLRKPAIPHYLRAVTLKLTKPRYEDRSGHPADRCRKKNSKNQKQEVNTFEQILAQEFLEKIRNSQLVAVFHQNPMNETDLFAARLQLKKLKIEFSHYNNTIIRTALTGTEYEPMLKLYESNTRTVFGEESNVAKLLKVQKKIPGLVLMAGVVEGRFMSVEDLQRYAKLPSLDGARSQLLAIINAPSQRLSQNITYHQRDLSSALSRYLSDRSPPDQQK